LARSAVGDLEAEGREATLVLASFSPLRKTIAW